MDRRKRKTLSALRQAVLFLIEHHGWDGVSVAAVCRQADIARSTYYLHFQTVEQSVLDALKALFEEDALQPADATLNPQTLLFGGQPLSLPVYAHIERHWALYTELLLHADAARLRAMLMAYLAEQSWQAHEPLRLMAKRPVDYTYITTVLSGALMASVQWWVQQDDPPSARAMAYRFSVMLAPGAMNLLGLHHLMDDEMPS